MAALRRNRSSLFLAVWMIALSMGLTNCSGCSSSKSGAMMISVPNVVGTSQSAATTAITGAGLTLGTVTMASSATVAAGDVISQNPAAGASVASGSAVNLTVSSGPAAVSVPSVVGDTQAAATIAITGAGLTLGTVTTASSGTVAAGNVISQNPAAGTSVASGSAVNLTVSSGPAAVSVPSVVGDTQAAATTAITGAGLTLGTVTTATSATVAAGDVISQNPTAGTSAASGSAVNLVVSLGPTAVSVPNVVGDTQAVAATAITAAGLTLGTVTMASSGTVAAGNVISQNPAAGTNVASGSAVNLTVSSGASSDIVTSRYDNARSGVNSHETILTTANVNSTSFGKLGEFTVDGQIDGQVLYLNQLNIPGTGLTNVIYAATENDSVYAFNADSVSGITGTFLWKTSVVPAGESPVDSASLPCGNLSFNGITATPVIDRNLNAIYVVAMTKDGSGNIIDRIHALDLTTGSELFGGPTTITATYPGTGGNSSGGVVTFLPNVQHDRAALLESNGVIYTTWSGLDGDCGSYSAWVITYNASTLAPAGAIDLVPNDAWGGMWMGGGGPAVDAAGNVYVITGNGATAHDTPGTNNYYGNSFVKLSNSGSLSVADYFTPLNTVSEDDADEDFGSAGPVLLPDLVDANNVTQHLAIGAGKDGNMYVVSRDNMGQFNAAANQIHQQIQISNRENFYSPVYFNGTVYVGPSGTPVEAYAMTQTMLPTTPTSQTTQSIGSGVTISANGTSNGIVWVVSNNSQAMYAFDANNLATQLYNTTQAAANRDKPASISGHFIAPMIMNGKVFFGTGSTVAVYGLLGP
jgi:beta-lactam-binding protein with PASTA domain